MEGETAPPTRQYVVREEWDAASMEVQESMQNLVDRTETTREGILSLAQWGLAQHQALPCLNEGHRTPLSSHSVLCAAGQELQSLQARRGLPWVLHLSAAVN